MSAMTPPAPENVAAMLAYRVGSYHDGNDWELRGEAEGNVVKIGIEPYADPDYKTSLPEVHFEAHVFQVDPPVLPPIVLARPDASFRGMDFEGGAFEDDDEPGWQVVPYSSTRNRNCPLYAADCIEFRGAPGRISFAEARRFAAALVAVADAAEVAQPKGGER